ncbi:hypothetical protein E2C01_027562 [Portunus trituberculatus]|uniref:Uncharacterized protein n=1 Tax=Portunus trituberculatus TaxID=210409 RepID=A0A5B7EIF5_PORTR|nr:hypothetical protein [Portunus trituberculatus]
MEQVGRRADRCVPPLSRFRQQLEVHERCCLHTAQGVSQGGNKPRRVRASCCAGLRVLTAQSLSRRRSDLPATIPAAARMAKLFPEFSKGAGNHWKVLRCPLPRPCVSLAVTPDLKRASSRKLQHFNARNLLINVIAGRAVRWKPSQRGLGGGVWGGGVSVQEEFNALHSRTTSFSAVTSCNCLLSLHPPCWSERRRVGGWYCGLRVPNDKNNLKNNNESNIRYQKITRTA